MELLQGAGITDVDGVQELFKEMVGSVLENGLEGELEEELGLFQKPPALFSEGHYLQTIEYKYGKIHLFET